MKAPDAALAGLGALGELDLEHADLRVGGDFPDTGFRERAVQRAHPVFGGADLHDDVAAAFEMKFRETALPRAHPYAGEFGAAGERGDRGVT
jgi:hypothetical protein